MYLEYFGLREEPFQLTPDPSFLYLSRPHARAKAYMEFAVLRRDGFVVISGDIGSGKTILLQSVLTGLDESIDVVRIFQTQVDEVDLLRVVLSQLGFKAFQASKVELLETLNRHLLDLYEAGRRVLLVIDEAHHLSPRALEELRMLTGLETTKEKIVNIILIGQRELDELLDVPELEQLRQRIRLRYDLGPLAEDEVRAYIEHRIRVAGGEDRALFADDVYPEIYRFTGGVPRLINTLCDTALLTAFVGEHEQVTLPVLRETIDELRWAPYLDPVHGRGLKLDPEASDDDYESAEEEIGHLLVFKGKRKVNDIPLDRRLVTLGRHETNDLRVPGRMVSRHHAQITTLGHNSFLVDLNSRNGTFVNDQPVRQVLLSDGDRIAIGDYVLRYVAPTHRRGGDERGKHESSADGDSTANMRTPKGAQGKNGGNKPDLSLAPGETVN